MVYAQGMEKHLEPGGADGEEKVNLEVSLFRFLGRINR